MKVFDIINDILYYKKGDLHSNIEFEQIFNTFFVARYLSMHPDLVLYAQWINKYQKVLSKENIYKFLISTIPTGNYSIKYIKPKKEKQDGTEN